MFKATREPYYWNYTMTNIHNLNSIIVKDIDGVSYSGGSFAEFGWDSKHAGINVLVSKVSTNLYLYYNMLLPFTSTRREKEWLT